MLWRILKPTLGYKNRKGEMPAVIRGGIYAALDLPPPRDNIVRSETYLLRSVPATFCHDE